MNNHLTYLVFCCLLSACSSTPSDMPDVPPSLFSTPKSFPLDTVNGYTINPFTGDSIQYPVHRNGDTIITGKRIPVEGTIIVDNLAPPTYTPVAPPTIVPIGNSVAQTPQDIEVFPLDETKLETFTIGVDTSSFVLVFEKDTTFLCH